MKDSKGLVIYVGKAKNLKSRVRQYFTGHDKRAQIDFLMARVKEIDFLQTNTETEALLLENSLIKKHKPRYNLFLKDDKTYLGLKLTVQEDFPRLLTTRRVKKDGATYFGPFTSSDSLRQVKEFINKYFLLRTCSDHEFNLRKRPCLEFQIKRCSAPCVDYVTEKEYQKQIDEVLLFLKGKSKDLKKVVKARMHEASKCEQFEEAARLRNLLQSMDLVLEGQNVTQLSFDFVDVIAMQREGNRVGVAVLMVRESKLIDSRYHVFKSLEDDEAFLHNFIVQYYTEKSFIPKEILVATEIKKKKILEDVLCERMGYKVKIRLPKRGEKKSVLNIAKQNLKSHFEKTRKDEGESQKALESLKKKLHLKKIPKRIECYDVSNISGKYAVASLVTFVDGKKKPDAYKKFKIRQLDSPNDYAMLKEVFERRFKRKEKGWAYPDLVLVDGGKGQLAQVKKVFEELDIQGIDYISIAKGALSSRSSLNVIPAKAGIQKGIKRLDPCLRRDDNNGIIRQTVGRGKGVIEDVVYLPNRKNPVKFKPGSKELFLLQRIRDEAHRFAIMYHRKLRDTVG